MDAETPVSDDYKPADNKFTGKIHKVTLRERFKDVIASGGSNGLRAAG